MKLTGKSIHANGVLEPLDLVLLDLLKRRRKYSSSKVLLRFFEFDLAKSLAKLRDKGFIIVDVDKRLKAAEKPIRLIPGQTPIDKIIMLELRMIGRFIPYAKFIARLDSKLVRSLMKLKREGFIMFSTEGITASTKSFLIRT
jgi:hypothetical protein